MGPPLHAATALAALLVLMLGSAGATVVVLTCDSDNDAQVTVNRIQTSVTVKCPSGCKAAGGSIYGTGTYTSDSPICVAAIHAGKPASGGQFTLYWAPGKSSYSGSTKNGITSKSYSQPWTSSYKFVGPALAPSVDCDKTNYDRDVVGVGDVHYDRTQLKLSCPGGCLSAGGNVYGSGAYTSDSRICLAAIHAGVINKTGGSFWIYDYTGLESYRGSTANQVTSKTYTSWGHSFRLRPITNLTCISANSSALVSASKPLAYAVCPKYCYDATGDVYGTSAAYRSNSAICRAALHAGVVTSNSGEVIIKYVAGLASYTSSTSHGIVSKSAAASSAAFKFV